MTTTFPSLRGLALGIVALGLGACATAPRQQLTDSTAAIQAAEAVGATEHPRAAYHLDLARKQLETAKPLVEGDRDEKKLAKDLLRRAQIDAQLAMSLAETVEVHQQAEDAWNEINELGREQ